MKDSQTESSQAQLMSLSHAVCSKDGRELMDLCVYLRGRSHSAISKWD